MIMLCIKITALFLPALFLCLLCSLGTVTVQAILGLLWLAQVNSACVWVECLQILQSLAASWIGNKVNP